MKQKKFKKTTKQEFDLFVASYKNQLDYDVTAICEPPLGSYNDFTNGDNWPESVVAKIKLHWLSQSGERDTEGHNRFFEYYILDV